MGTFLQDLYDAIVARATIAVISASSPGSENAEPLVWDAASSLYVPLSSVNGTGGDLDWAGATFANAGRKTFSIATDADHTLDYADGDFQVLPSGVLSNDRNFTLPSGVADGLAFTFMSLENMHGVYIVGASKPSGGADPVIAYTTSTYHCVTFRRVNSTWQLESTGKWLW